ncbi:MAG: DNA polymerase III subunit beta [Tissierellia bacterium]|nr:DNA polymerase III subunit beta [Tissierellia bacterium]MDD4779981.1 DNA polymerase III subunit beta [Tissierellia bacterium]
MKIRINQDEFNKSINIVQKAVSSRTTLPILTGILIEAIDNKLILTATDLDLGIKTYCDCEVIEEGSIVIHAKLIGDFIRKLPSNTIVNMETTQNNNIEIKCLNSEFNILGNSSNEYPDSSFNNDGTSFEIKSDSLKSLIKYTHFAAAIDNIKPIFTGCLIEIKNNMCTFVALDGFRMSIKKENIDFNGEVSAVVPTKTLIEILRILEETEDKVLITVSESHISFKIDKTTIISNLLEGKFLDYVGILKDDFQTVIKIDNSNFKDSIERASLMARGDKNNLIIFDIKDNCMQITSTSEYGNVEEVNSIEKQGEDIKIGFNSKYILDVLRVIENEYIEMNLIGKNNPCFIKEENNENFIYMILPVRIG